MVSQADLELISCNQYWFQNVFFSNTSQKSYWFVVKTIKFIKVKTRFSLEHVINGLWELATYNHTPKALRYAVIL